MDRGYLDFARLSAHQTGAFFVTRAKSPMDARRLYSAPRIDERRALRSTRCSMASTRPGSIPNICGASVSRTPSRQDADLSDQQHRLPALTICALYKSRWQVELFFKWIKQHLRIKHFLGNSDNAVKTQVWCAIATYVLIAIVKRELQLNASLYTSLQILSVSVFEKTDISCALQLDQPQSEQPDLINQLILFDF